MTEILVRQPEFFGAEQEGYGPLNQGPADQTRAVLEAPDRVLQLAVSDGGSTHNQAAIAYGIGERGELLRGAQQGRRAHGGARFAEGHVVGFDHAQAREAEIRHGARGRSDIERVPRGNHHYGKIVFPVQADIERITAMPAKSAKAPVRARRSKPAVQQEFEDIQKEVERVREAPDAKGDEVARMREAEVRQAVEAVTVDAVVQRISGLGLEVSRALADVSGKLTEEVQLLASVREAVALERKELDRLHKIDTAATALDQMVQDYTLEKQRLESEIADQRAAWEEESERVERERKEQEEGLKKQRQREIDDYEYKKTLERKKAQDKYDEDMRLLEKRNQEKQEALEKGWKQREAVLKEREEDLARLRKESEEFPARLQKEAQAAAEQARRETEARLDQQMLVLKKDIEAEKRLAALQVKTLEDTAARQQAQIAALEKQLADAKQQVQDIAVKAIEGASGAKALAHINQIAMEQAKNRPQG